MESQPNHDLSNVLTGMENDPNADERVIDQTTLYDTDVPEDVNPSGIESLLPTKEQPRKDDLANALAYALDGSGVGLAGAPPAASARWRPAQKVVSEGVTGADLDDEEENA